MITQHFFLFTWSLFSSDSSVKLPASATSSSQWKPFLSLCSPFLTFFHLQALSLRSLVSYFAVCTRFSQKTLFFVFPLMVRIFVQPQRIHFFSVHCPLTCNPCYQWTLKRRHGDQWTTKVQHFLVHE